MTRSRILFSSLLLLFGVLLLVPATPVHAATGTVCIIPSGSTTCPSSPASITGTVGSQLRVSVFIQNSNALNGFDITLLADHTVLKPANYDLTGSVLPSPPNVLVFCRQGILVQGTTCSSTDSIDTLHLAAVGALGQITVPPTTGLLFTAIYNVTAASSGTSLGFQTGCPAPTSVSGTCVNIANGTPTPDPETVQTAVFSTSASPDFGVTASPSTLIIARGQTSTETLTITSSNGFSGTISGTGSITPVTKHSPSFPTSISTTISSGQTVNLPLAIGTVKNTPTGNYVVTYVLTSGSLSHSVSFTVTVIR